MNELAIFIVTKDRPLTFHAAISSIRKNLSSDLPIYTLVKWSTDRYEQAYKKVKREFDMLEYWPEYHFRNNFLDNLRWFSGHYKYLCGFTDDTIFYRKIDNLDLGWMDEEDCLSLSLRLGQNTTIQDIEHPSNKIIFPYLFDDNHGNIWNWYEQKPDVNVGYPISIDGNIYRTIDLLKISEAVEFHNLREWEGETVAKTRELVKNGWDKQFMACLPYSYCVNIPMNFVQYPFNPTVGPHGETVQEQLKRFEQGERVDLEKTFENIEVIGSHQFVKFSYMNV